MPRVFSLNRRRKNLLDITIPSKAGIGSYQFAVSNNFDGMFSDFQVVPSAGYRSRSVVESAQSSLGFRGLTRFLLDPDDYVMMHPELDDTKPFWFTVAEIPYGGAAGTPSAPHLVLPYNTTPNLGFNIAGSVSGSVTEIQLPMLVSNIIIDVVGPDDLNLAYEENGTIFTIPVNAGLDIEYWSTYHTTGQLFLSSSGMDTEFKAAFRLMNSLAL